MRIEKFERKFCAELIDWVKSPEALMQFAGPAFSFPLTIEQLHISLDDEKRYAFRFTDEETTCTVGYGEIYLNENAACLGRIIVGDEKKRGTGLGAQMVRLLLDVAFLELLATKAELNVFDWNTGAIKCYEKAGFVLNPSKKLERRIGGATWTAVNMIVDKTALYQPTS